MWCRCFPIYISIFFIFSPPFFPFPPTVVWFVEDSREESSYDASTKTYEDKKETEDKRVPATVDEGNAEHKVWE